jgi:hypothetical protein
VSLHVGTGKASQADTLLGALARGRSDHQFFSRAFLNRTLTDAQLEYVVNAHATINVLATSNRWGKTTVLSNVHYRGCIYKEGAESRFLDDDGNVDVERFAAVRFNTIHTADDWETASLVWDEALKLKNENSTLAAFIKNAPKSKPPHIEFINGSKWKFRTLGDNASGIDGNSFYIISIDEAGWMQKLEEMMDNVIRVRVADVRGVIHIVGTMKPGISRDFYKYGVRASAHTGVGVTLDHRGNPDDDEKTENVGLDGAIRGYVREWIERELSKGRTPDQDVWDELTRIGITKDEYADAIAGANL